MARSEFKNWAVDEAGNVIASAAFEVRWRGDDSLVTTLYDAATGSGTVSNPGTATSGGLVNFWLPYGEYEVTIGSGASAITYPFDVAPPINANRSFASRAAAVTEWAAMVARGEAPAAGTVWSWPGASVVYDGSSTMLTGLSGWKPVGESLIEHVGGTGDGTTDEATAFAASFTAFTAVNLQPATYALESQVSVPAGAVISSPGSTGTISAEEGAGFGVGDALLRVSGVDNVEVRNVDFDVDGGSDNLRGVTYQNSDGGLVDGLTGTFTGRGTYPVLYVGDSNYHRATNIDVEFEDYGLLWKPQFSDPTVTDPGDADYHTGSNFVLTNSSFKGLATGDGGKIGVSIDGELVGGLISGVSISDISDLLSVGESFGVALANESDDPERFRGVMISGALFQNIGNEAVHFEDEMRSVGGVGVAVVDCGHGIRISAAAVASHTPPDPAVTTDGVARGTVHTGYVIDGIVEEAITIEGATHTALGGEGHVFSNMIITDWNTGGSGSAAVWFPAEFTNSIICQNLIFRDATGDVFRINADHGGASGFNDGPIIIDNIVVHNVTGDVFDIITTESNDHIFIKSGSILSGATNVFSSTSSLNNVTSDRKMQSALVTAGVAAGPTYALERADEAGYLLQARFIFEDANDASSTQDFWKLQRRSTGGTVTTVAVIGMGTGSEAAFEAKSLNVLGTASNRAFDKGDVFYMEKSGAAGDGTYSGRFEFIYMTYF